MTKQPWFKSIRVVDRSRLMQRFARMRDRDEPLPRLRGPRIIDIEAWKYPRVGTRMMFIDREETVYSTRDIERIFDVDKSTVYKWIKMGVLPEPLFSRMNYYNKETRYYVRPQLVVVARVLNDLRRQGVIRLNKRRIAKHLDMIRKGNEIALREWSKRRDRKFSRRQIVKWISSDE